MNNEGSYYEVFSLERRKDRAEVLKRTKTLKETGSVRRPDMRRDVIMPTFWAFVLGFGFIFSFAMVLMGWYESYNEPRVWYAALGFTLMAGSWFGITVMRDQIAHYRDLQVVTREFQLEVADSGRARLLRPDPDNPRRTTIDRYQWQAGKLQEFARAHVDRQGAWIGPDRLIRKHLDSYVLNVSERYEDVVADFVAWGWLRVDGEIKYWTERGKVEMARKAYG